MIELLKNRMCYVICNCNVANIDIYFFFSSYIYLFVRPFFVSQKKNSSNAATREKKTNFLITRFFFFIKILKSSQRILLAFGFLLLFFPLSVICCLQSVQWLGHDNTVLLFWFLQFQFWACSLLLYILVGTFICQAPVQCQWKGNHSGVSLRCFAFVSVEFGENLGLL